MTQKRDKAVRKKPTFSAALIPLLRHDSSSAHFYTCCCEERKRLMLILNAGQPGKPGGEE
jgi:hypothetical protein